MKVKCIKEPPTHSHSFVVGESYIVYTDSKSKFNHVVDKAGNRYGIPSAYFSITEYRNSQIEKILS